MARTALFELYYTFYYCGVDDKNYFYFKLYESEEEFREATQDWQ